MISGKIRFLIKPTLILIFTFIIPHRISAQPSEIKIQLDGASKYQTLDGFGVNINTAWWYNGEYKDTKVMEPAIDLLVDSLGATIFRAVIEEIDWEAVNDNNDPDNFNWNYYNKVFSNARFQGVWNTLRYLNKKGITDGLVISFMGAPPASAPKAEPDQKKSWMGGMDYTIATNKEDELVESIAALLYYMRYTAGIQFKLVSPLNETDVISMSKNAEHPDGIVEGPNIPDAGQFVRVIRKLARKLDAIGMDDIRFVAPDAAGDRLFGNCFAEMVKDSYLMGKLAHWGVHQYGNDAANYLKIVSQHDNPNKSFWVTETAGIGNMLGQLNDNATAYIFWDGFDCVYQHARRNGYGSQPPNDWVFWFGPEGKPLIKYSASSSSWKPRKQFYQFSQVMKYVKGGAVRIGIEGNDSSLILSAFRNTDGSLVITGRNINKQECSLNVSFANIPDLKNLKLIYTDSTHNLVELNNIKFINGNFLTDIPPEAVFTIIGKPDSGKETIKAVRPEPEDWYAGDMHVHRNCGDGTSVLPENEFTTRMETNDLAVISVLADMGDAEVKDSKTDLPKVNGNDAAQSTPGRTVHWDAEWHFDPAGTTFENKALGGHIVLLGLSEAHTIWDESPYKILAYGRSQNAIVGFCHMQYLKDSIPGILDCCTPIDYPVEAALGTIDFLAEDVWLNDASVNSYYRLLNCGFRLGWAAGTDFPCNNSEPFGSLLTYAQVKNKPFSYRQWVEGIKNGRTVVTTNGHKEFLDLKVNGSASPGDEIKLKDKGSVSVEVKWITVLEQTGRIELMLNGKVVAIQEGNASPGLPVILKANVPIHESSWLCARRMDDKGHRSHTAPVYVSLKNAPVRASASDAEYFIRWIDKTITNTSPGGPWNKYFTHDLDVVQDRYRRARSVYEKIALEATKEHKRPDEKHVAPVLILATNQDFGTYTSEILKTEGFNGFELDSLGSDKISKSFLSKFDLVLLAESKIENPKLSILKDYVKKGGRLISLHSYPELADVFGIAPLRGSITDGYVRIDTSSFPGKGLSAKQLKFHGKADYYKLNGAVTLATLSANKDSGKSFPAVVSSIYGKGQTVAFLYNLPQCIVLSRQGNPLNAGIEKDSIPGLRGMDLFTNGWLDTSDNSVNKTDEQMALLSHCIENILADKMPVPRFWYFPDTLKCLVTLTNDGEYKSEKDFEPQFRDVDSMGAKMSLYIIGVDKVSGEFAKKWTARGFEIAGHPDDTKEAGNPTWTRMDSVLNSGRKEIASHYGLPMRTNVNHWFVWCGKDYDGKQEFAAEAKLEEKNGIELDINYAHYDLKSNQGDHYLGQPGTNQGNYTGSGLVMKFADSHGKTINVYQQLNAVYDQEYTESHDPQGFYDCFKGLMDRSLNNEAYSFISVKAHNDEYSFSKIPLMKMLAYAKQNRIPVWTEVKLLDFLKMKDEASITSISWKDDKLTFSINSGLKNSNGLTFMAPANFKDLRIKGISIDGNKAKFITRSVKGSVYAFATVESGKNHSIIVTY